MNKLCRFQFPILANGCIFFVSAFVNCDFDKRGEVWLSRDKEHKVRTKELGSVISFGEKKVFLKKNFAFATTG